VQQQLASTASEKESLSQEKSTLQSFVSSVQKTQSQLEEKLLQVAAELAASNRQLQTTQNELKVATRRAEAAEKTQQDLQAEGTTLLRSLDEMRPKIVELTGVKLELGEKVDGLEHTLRNRDATIAQLEADLDELRDQKEQIEHRMQEVLAQREKDRSLAQASSGELQKAYAELREELDVSADSVMALEMERSNHRQESARRLEEIETLTATSNAQADELSALRQEVAERQNDQDEEQEFLVRAQNEIESLRLDIAAKDEELERLREAVSSPTKANDEDPHSLDHELLSSLRQQHALELSAAQSQIRALENAVFDADAKAHALRKQLSALEDQLTHQNNHHAHARPPSLPSSSRPASRAASARTSNAAPAPLARAVFDQNLTAETRHKRKVSLSMLKARIDSELAARPLSPVHSVDSHEGHDAHSEQGQRHRPQFLDDSHVFWCHACRGDLVIL
jgi:myosin protein heavy chain